MPRNLANLMMLLDVADFVDLCRARRIDDLHGATANDRSPTSAGT